MKFSKTYIIYVSFMTNIIRDRISSKRRNYEYGAKPTPIGDDISVDILKSIVDVHLRFI